MSTFRTLLTALALACGSCTGASPSAPNPAEAEHAAEPAGPCPDVSESAEPPSCPPPPCPECEETEVLEEATQSSKGAEALTFSAATFADLPGWDQDQHAKAVGSLMRSCAILAKKKSRDPIGVPKYAGRVRDWLPLCKAGAKIGDGDDGAAKKFFERYFKVYAANGKSGTKAKLSGYYVQSARGSLRKHGKYQTPLLKRPADLVETQLSDFIKDGRGRRIWGRRNAKTGKLERYPTRPQMRAKGVSESQVLLWLDDPIDAVFAEIQGSAVVTMDDGSTRWAAFDGKNGRRFRGVGGILRRMGELKRGQGTMQGTRAWFEKNPRRYHEIVDKNTAKVFFKFGDRAGAIGTQDAVLTARRSVAIDRAVIAFSTPIWIEGRAPVGRNGRVVPWSQLLIAQDTGGAILGPIRADIYWGEGREAGEIAGRMGGPGRMWLLLPRKLKVPTRSP